MQTSAAASSSEYEVRRTPFTRLILDFQGRNLASDEIESDYRNTINYPNNYFVAPASWRESFYTLSRRSMLQVSRGIENIARVRPPFNKFVYLALFQKPSNFQAVRKQYETIAPLTKGTYIIGPAGTGAGSRPTNAFIVNDTGSNLEHNWLVIALAEDEACGLVAEEFEPGNYRGFFTTNKRLVVRSVQILQALMPALGPFST
ncbi:MAG: DICT sensory domain-containing protein [Nitrososphaera sp.]|jgi:hypothetical protein